MSAILASEFVWGLLGGLILSIIGGWALAHFTVGKQRSERIKLVKRLCRDTANNVIKITDEFDGLREKTSVIFQDYLNLIDIEVQVYGRNREHLVLLSEAEAGAARKFFTDVSMRRAEVLTHLNSYYRSNEQSIQARSAGNGPASQDLARLADQYLANAHAASDRLVKKVKEDSQPVLEM